MVAHVVPCTRLPRSLGWFDYAIPDGVKVVPGDVVTIQFRRHRTLGVVLHTAAASSVPDKRLLTLQPMAITWRLPSWFLQFVLWLADRYAVAPGTLLQHSVFPARRELPGEPLDEPVSHESTVDHQLVVYQREADRQTWLHDFRQQTQGRILILTPTYERVQRLLTELPGSLGFVSETARKQAQTFSKLPSANTIIGTRSILLTPLPALAAIVIDNEGHWLHEASEQQPRFAVEPVARQLAAEHGARLVALTPSPSLRQVMTTSVVTLPGHSATVRLLPLPSTAGRPGAFHAVTLQTLQQAVENQQPVFVYMARRGNARLVRCRTCNWTATCKVCSQALVRHDALLRCHVCGFSEPTPVVCPQCGSTSLQSLLPGSAGVAEQLQQRFQTSVTLIDSDRRRPTDIATPIVVGTEYAWPLLEQFRPKHCIVLGLDAWLRQPRLAIPQQSAFVLRSLAALDSVESVLVETRFTDHPLLQAVAQQNPVPALQNEFATRQRLGLPPAVATQTLEATTTPSARAALNQWLEQQGVRSGSLVGPFFLWRGSREREYYRLLTPPPLDWRSLPDTWLVDPDSVD